MSADREAARRVKHIIFNCECRHEQTAREALDDLDALLAELAAAREREGLAVEALGQIAGATPTSHRKTIDQLTDAVKWRQGIARDALVRIAALSEGEG